MHHKYVKGENLKKKNKVIEVAGKYRWHTGFDLKQLFILKFLILSQYLKIKKPTS